MLAEKALKRGTWLEYHCYDQRGRSQGTAVVIFDRWVSPGDLEFQAQHMAASDGSYEYWINRGSTKGGIYTTCVN